MKLVDEIEKVIAPFAFDLDGDGARNAAQEVIDVVERRLSKITVESCLDSLDFEKGTATFSVPEDCQWFSGEYLIINKTAWQAAKGCSK